MRNVYFKCGKKIKKEKVEQKKNHLTFIFFFWRSWIIVFTTYIPNEH